MPKKATRNDLHSRSGPFIHEPDRLQFSFSGLKTAVRYTLERIREKGELPSQLVRDVAASFQAAVIDCLVAKAVRAVQMTRLPRLCVGGGVAANRRLRAALNADAEQGGYELIIAPPKLCTDNAVMGGIAIEKLVVGQFDDLSLDIQPGLVRV